MPDFDLIKSELEQQKAKQGEIEKDVADLKTAKAEQVKIKKDVDALKTLRIWVLAFVGVLTFLGIKGEFLISGLNTQLTDLQKRVKDAEIIMSDGVETRIKDADEKIKAAVQKGEKEIDEYASNLTKTILPVVTLLDSPKQKEFLSPGNKIDLGNPEASEAGVTVPCADIVPQQATGAIVQLYLAPVASTGAKRE